MKCRAILLIGLVCMTFLSCGGGEPFTSEKVCADRVCDEANLTVNTHNLTANHYDTEGEGFITLSDSKRYFQHENGTPFIPIGHNEWYSAQMFLDAERLDRYFSVMKDHGENVIRVILDYQGLVTNLPFNFNKTNNLVELKVGEYNPELIGALDDLVHTAERHGIYLLIALLPNLYDDLQGANWHEHPYNKRYDPEKGLVENPEELLHDAASIRAVKARFRFFIERWGGSPNIFAWDLWNEINAIGGTLEQQNEWIQEMGAFTRQLELELYGRYHLRTVSTNNAGWGSEDSGIYSSSELDFTSYHTYDSWGKVGINPFEGFPMFSRVDPIKYIQFIYQAAQLTLTKSAPRPILSTEDMGIARNSAGGLISWPFDQHFKDYTEEQLDDLFIGAAWPSVLAGGAGPGLRWPCNPAYGEDDPEGYLALSYGMYNGQKALNEILSTIDWTTFSPTPASHVVSAEGREEFISMALTDGTVMLAFFLHDDPEFSRVEVSPFVTVRSLRRTSYRVTWYDLRTGDVLQQDRAQGPEFSVQAPTFKTFVAAVVQTY